MSVHNRLFIPENYPIIEMSVHNRLFTSEHYPIKQYWFTTDHSFQNNIQSSTVGI